MIRDRILDIVSAFVRRCTGEEEEISAPFPHCDPRILHAPNTCTYCDMYPHYQELRKSWDINFTGQDHEYNEYARGELKNLKENKLPTYHWIKTLEDYKSYVLSTLEHNKLLPCPADYNRERQHLEAWQGNMPTQLTDRED